MTFFFTRLQLWIMGAVLVAAVSAAAAAGWTINGWRLNGTIQTLKADYLGKQQGWVHQIDVQNASIKELSIRSQEAKSRQDAVQRMADQVIASSKSRVEIIQRMQATNCSEVLGKYWELAK